MAVLMLSLQSSVITSALSLFKVSFIFSLQYGTDKPDTRFDMRVSYIIIQLWWNQSLPRLTKACLTYNSHRINPCALYESEVGSDMLLVSGYFCTSNIMSIQFETRHNCKPYNIRVYITWLLDCIINQALATSVWFNIDIYIYWNDYKTSETSNMSVPISDSFCLISSHILLFLSWRYIFCFLKIVFKDLSDF